MDTLQEKWDQAVKEVMDGRKTIGDACRKAGVPQGSFHYQMRKRGQTYVPAFNKRSKRKKKAKRVSSAAAKTPGKTQAAVSRLREELEAPALRMEIRQLKKQIEAYRVLLGMTKG